jgi:8-oxo-dGTP pyrophosphatase MutT (NUDIX family)
LFNFVKGNGTTDPIEAQRASFAKALAKLDELIAQHKITPRDLKCRFDGCTVEIQNETVVLTISIGPTQYYACMQDVEQSEQTAHKIQRGLEQHQDAKYYLTCGMGVVVLPYTKNGRVLLGRRRGHDYNGWWHGLAGWLPFKRELSHLNPVTHARLECVEELGITDQQLEPLEFLGIISFKQSFETDIVFCMRMSNELVEAIVEKQIWQAAQDAYEHDKFAVFFPYEALLSHQKLMPSTEFGLHVLYRRQKYL